MVHVGRGLEGDYEGGLPKVYLWRVWLIYKMLLKLFKVCKEILMLI